MLTAGLVILALILINALYVAAEFGAVSVRQTQIRQLAEEGNRTATLLLPVVTDAAQLDRYIAASQIGITLSSLVLGAYGQATLALDLAPLVQQWSGLSPLAARSTAAVVVLVGLTTLQVVLGELVPKSVALQYPTQIALLTAWPMRWSQSAYAAFIHLLNGSGLAVLRLLGAEPNGHRHIHSPEEIDLLMAESRDGGLLEPDEYQRLHQTLLLATRPVRQIMVPRPRVQAIAVTAPPEEVLERVLESPYSRFPVYEGSIDHVVGILHTKDVALHYTQHREIPPVRAVMRPAVVVPENMMADRLLQLLRERRCQQAVVVDEFGGVEGIVTLEDVLEEVLGEFADEFKTGTPHPQVVPDGRVRLPGSTRLDEAEPWIGTRWEGRADTVAGHIMEALGRLPQTGERFSLDGVDVEIEAVAHHTVASVLVVPPRKGGEQAWRAG